MVSVTGSMRSCESLDTSEGGKQENDRLGERHREDKGDVSCKERGVELERPE
jgi:hypothetical protein